VREAASRGEPFPGCATLLESIDALTDQIRGLERRIAELGVADRVTLAGVVDRAALPDFLRGARVLCVPSRREPFGLVILEGFACGVPVVASRVDGIPEVTGDAIHLWPLGRVGSVTNGSLSSPSGVHLNRRSSRFQ